MGGYVYTSATFLPSLQTLLPPSSRQSGMFRFLLPVQFIWNIVSWLSGARLHQPKRQETVCKNCEVAPGGWIQVAPHESCNALVPRWPVTGQVPSRYDRVWAVRPPREAPLHLVQRSQRAFWKLQQCQVCSSGPLRNAEILSLISMASCFDQSFLYSFLHQSHGSPSGRRMCSQCTTARRTGCSTGRRGTVVKRKSYLAPKLNVWSLSWPNISRRWATGQSQWHSDQPHKYLVKYLDILTKVS